MTTTDTTEPTTGGGPTKPVEIEAMQRCAGTTSERHAVHRHDRGRGQLPAR